MSCRGNLLIKDGESKKLSMLALNCVTTKSYDFKSGLYPIVKEYAETVRINHLESCLQTYRDQYKERLKETTKFRDTALKITEYKKESNIDAWMMYYSRLMGIINDFPCTNYLVNSLLK